MILYIFNVSKSLKQIRYKVSFMFSCLLCCFQQQLPNKLYIIKFYLNVMNHHCLFCSMLSEFSVGWRHVVSNPLDWAKPRFYEIPNNPRQQSDEVIQYRVIPNLFWNLLINRCWNKFSMTFLDCFVVHFIHFSQWQ